MSDAISADSLLEHITQLTAELHPESVRYQEVTLDSNLDGDLGLDSLARTELIARLEKAYDVRLPEEALGSAETPRDLLRYMQSAAPATATSRIQERKHEEKSSERKEITFSTAQTLIDVLNLHVRQQPDAQHITLLEKEEEVQLSYGMLQRQSLKVLATLQQIDIEPGDRVAIMLPTSQHYFACFFGALYCGAVPVPLYPPARPSQIEEHVRRHQKILSNSGAKVLLTIAEVKPVARLLMSQVPELRTILTVEELYGTPPDKVALAQKPDDVAFLQYTSGSTGDPKGVILSHANLLTNIRAMGRVCEVTARDVFVSWLPLYHDMGLIGAWFGSLCYGCRLVVMSPLSFLSRPERWLHAIDRYGGTLSASPNFGYEICATRIDDTSLKGLDLSSWRMAFNGAEPVLPATMRRFGDRFAQFGFQKKALAPVYGLAESSVGLVFPTPGSGLKVDRVQRETFSSSGVAEPATEDDDSALEFISSGRPLPGHQVRAVDKSDREVADRNQGRLQFKGPSATSGYFRNSRQTKKLFRGEWLETGDLGYIAAGEVYLTGRQKDIIIRGGRNIFPHELEDVVGSIEGLRKGCTAVFGSRLENESGERLVVLTESRIRDEQKLDELKSEVNKATVSLLGLPADEVIIGRPGTVLKTSSGKIRRSACRQLYESGSLGRKKATVRLQLLRMSLASVKPLVRRMIRQIVSTGYAVYCWCIFGVVGGLVWPVMMILPAGSHCWKLCSWAARLIGRLTRIRIDLEGRENYRLGSDCILVSNHMSYIDAMILTGVLPESVSFVAKKELSDNIFLRPALKKLKVFLVDRFDARKGAEDSKVIAREMHTGRRPLFFAEGTLQRMPGLLPFQMGAFTLARDRDLPIVPVIIRGSRNILRGGAWFPRRGKVEVFIEAPCQPSGNDWQGAIELRDRVRRVILDRLGEPDLAGEYTSLLQLGLGKAQPDDSARKQKGATDADNE